LGKKTYHIFDGKRITKQNIDNLKDFSLAEDLIKTLSINPDLLLRAEKYLGSLSNLDATHDNFTNLDNINFDNRIIFVGHPGLEQMNKFANVVESKKYKILYAIIPDLQCMPWYNRIDVTTSAWHGVSPDDDSDTSFWVDCCNRKVILPSITWYIAKWVT
jgi:hypothetical protein